VTVLSPAVAACFEKEWVYVRRNPAQFYGLIAPLAMVFLFAGRLGSFAKTGMIFPAAVAYSVLGIAALAYNVLGLDASGVQFYFMAPIQLRSVFLAKNLFGFAITAVQVVLVYLVITFTAGRPPWLITVTTLCWVVFACLTNTTIGNIRSVVAPKKMDPSKISRRQASQLSALLCIGIMLAIAGVGAGLVALSKFLAIPWLPVPILLALAIGAFALYLAGLNGIDTMALSRRETLIEELSKAS
jgi:ABC-2 type transport system permease protein